MICRRVGGNSVLNNCVCLKGWPVKVPVGPAHRRVLSVSVPHMKHDIFTDDLQAQFPLKISYLFLFYFSQAQDNYTHPRMSIYNMLHAGRQDYGDRLWQNVDITSPISQCLQAEVCHYSIFLMWVQTVYACLQMGKSLHFTAPTTPSTLLLTPTTTLQPAYPPPDTLFLTHATVSP